MISSKMLWVYVLYQGAYVIYALLELVDLIQTIEVIYALTFPCCPSALDVYRSTLIGLA